MSNRLTNIIAFLLLVFVFFVCFFSVKNDSLTMDELAHLPAGYSYLSQKDMRLNPEHPPLIKDLAAIPLIFIKNINFPYNLKDWKEDINGQWGFGNKFLYYSENPTDEMIFWARIPMILVLLILGFYIFFWAKESFGNKTALLALFLFSFSPTFLAHGRLVTTDVGAALGVTIATYYFLKFLNNPSKKNLFLSGIALGLAELMKFSLILLLPFFVIILFFWIFNKLLNYKNFLKDFLKVGAPYFLYLLFIFIIAYILVWGVYQYHVFNEPPQKQVSDTKFLLSSFGSKTLASVVVWMADKPILKPLSKYLLGLFMALQRAVGGNTTYFLGEVSAAGWKTYFPTVYAIKEPLAFHLLVIIAIVYSALLIKKPLWEKPLLRFRLWLKSHFSEFAMLIFIVIYWATSLKSNLNIGIRHLLPVFPFTILLVSKTIVSFLENPPLIKIKKGFLILLLIWQMISVLTTYPYFLSYFNELAGGFKNGYIYTVDSNYDWGQDLKRLVNWLEKNKIEKIYVDYFGGSDVKYYLKDKYLPWWGTRNPNEMPKGSYLAVSATFLMGGIGEPAPGFDLPTRYYQWLCSYKPVAQIGSIFVFYIN